MKNVSPVSWPKNAPPQCDKTNDWAFDSESDARAFIHQHSAGGVEIDWLYRCQHCDAFHARTHLRDTTGKREESRFIPIAAEAGNRELSIRDSRNYWRSRNRPASTLA